MKELSEMAGSELVAEFNARALVRGQPPVKRFADRKTAIRRIQALDVTIPSQPAQRINGVVADFGVAPSSNRAKLLEALFANLGKQVPLEDLTQAVYGSTDKKYRSALNMVVTGLLALIKKKSLNFAIVKQKKENSLGLHIT
jgi:hypothetical protein